MWKPTKIGATGAFPQRRKTLAAISALFGEMSIFVESVEWLGPLLFWSSDADGR